MGYFSDTATTGCIIRGMAIPLSLTSEQLVAAVERLEGQRLPIRKLAWWAQSNVLVPSIDWQHRRRTPRLYSLRDVAKARIVLRLRAAKIPMSRVRLVMAELAAAEDLPTLMRAESRAWLEVDGWRVRIHRVGQPAQELPQPQFVLPFADVVRDSEQVVRDVMRAAA